MDIKPQEDQSQLLMCQNCRLYSRRNYIVNNTATYCKKCMFELGYFKTVDADGNEIKGCNCT